MKNVLVACVAVISMSSAASAATVVEPLRPRAGKLADVCSADKAWCITTAAGGATVRYRDVTISAKLPLEKNEDERVESAVWPSIVRIALPGQPEFALVGVTRTQTEAYSGGGGSVTTLTLFELKPAADTKPRNVFTAPLESSFLIRACFSATDEKKRRGACHDEYRYSASVTAPGSRADVRLVYQSRADSFPGRRDRLNDDSATEGPLRKADLFRAVDASCTFKRNLIREAATGELKWNAPPPSCPAYVELQ